MQLKNDDLTKANVEAHAEVMSRVKALRVLKGAELKEAR